MRIAMIYGEFSTRDKFVLDDLYTKRGLTGSETSFFNLARTLSERGHEVVVFCPSEGAQQHESGFVSFPIEALSTLRDQQGYKACIAWNEPDYLQHAPPGALRIVDQQLNDFYYVKTPGWQNTVDVCASPSTSHLLHLLAKGAPPERTTVIPNSVDMGLLPTAKPERKPHQVVYASSPDRGLHHVLAMWPAIRREIPDAELKIFYRIQPWIEHFQGVSEDQPRAGAIARRARYIAEAVKRLENHGVTVVGPVPNRQMMHELSSSRMLLYPCDTVAYTEGFGCSVLDAAAAGCVPLVSNRDALGSVHYPGAIVVDASPGEERVVWIHEAVKVLKQDAIPQDWTERMTTHAMRHRREVITDQWEKLLSA